MEPAPSVPLQIAGYNVLSLSLPPLPSLPAGATHYLYVGPHRPKFPTPTAERSLFLINVPFDATVFHLKHLLSQQIGLPAGRIEDVQFEGQRPKDRLVENATNGDRGLGRGSKKRKRGGEATGSGRIESIELPSTWDRDLLVDNMTAVVLFVDKSSANAALKAVKKVRKKRKLPVWGEDTAGKVPELGSASTFDDFPLLLLLC